MTESAGSTQDPSARDWARTRTSDATTPPPPPAQAEKEAVSATVPPVVGDAGPAPAPRASLLVQGLMSALAAGALVAAAVGGTAPLTAAVLVVQVVLVLSTLALLDAPAAAGAAVLASGAALAADVVVLVDGGLDGLAGVVGLVLVASLLHQLLRGHRSRVTESVADTSLAVLLAVGAACLLVLPASDDGRALLLLLLAAAAGALLAGRAGDRLLSRPALGTGSSRSWGGLVLAALVGAGLAVALADSGELSLTRPAAALAGLAVVLVVAAADLAVDVGAAELRTGRRDARRVAAVPATATLLPYALLGPVAVLLSRVVLA